MDNKKTITAWVSKAEKEAWKKLAVQNNLTVSAFTNSVILKILGSSKKETKPLFEAEETGSEQQKYSLHFRFTESEMQAIQKLAEQRKQSRQEVVIAAVRQFLLNKIQIEPADKEMLINSTLALNKVGTNLNQIARVLNSEAKIGKVESNSIAQAQEVILSIDDSVQTHIKNVEKFLNQHSNRAAIKSKVS